ncbi:glycosyltransferase [Winogradskyella pelagia]|uniref:glycosyltransferase n=1 Tax=Winogradskyella pelagia TaxID=2819984 RepID=UPI001FBBB879|nr:glycosyltransferase [Winogradskyella sp. DF17]
MGHATRCIPIVRELLLQGFEPLIASDGEALLLLQKEFPGLASIELPSYNISYPKNGNSFKYKLLKDSPHLLSIIKKEKWIIKQLVEAGGIAGIISDNRFGVRHKAVPCVFISHQIRVLSGITTWFSTKFHQNIISKFDECWVPDVDRIPNLSGKLGHVEDFRFPIKYIGPLSRFKKKNINSEYDLLVLLSGPEPQRSMLSEALLHQLHDYEGKVCFIKGTIESKQTTTQIGSITVHNFLFGSNLENVINASEIILSRSGYTTIMDLAKLGKKAFFIPTPGQFEQEYLAEKLKLEGIAPSCNQKDFTLDKINLVKDYTGFSNLKSTTDFKGLFNLFKSEGEFATHA